MTLDEFKSHNRIEDVLASKGITLRGKAAKCPFHEDRNASLSVDVNKQLWNCHAGCGGGDVVNLLARYAGQEPAAYIRSLDLEKNATPKPSAKATQHSRLVKTYSYTDEIGRELFQVCRYEPKTFKQRHSDGKGGWIWGMDGVNRVLYRLPQVVASDTIALCEGEKDAETVTTLGFCGTCNVGGAGKWLDGYTDALTGKNVLIFGDNDEAGKKQTELVFDSIAGKVKSAKLIEIPKQFKDVTEYVESLPAESAKQAVEALVAAATPFVGGIKLPLFTMADIEARYTSYTRNIAENSFELGRWLPSLHRVRSLVPGDLAMIVGNTGIGKTALLSSLILAAKPLPSIMFQLELPEEIMFERFVAAATKKDAREVESAYAEGKQVGPEILGHCFNHMLFCCEPRKTVEEIERYITRSELKFGQKPRLVVIDYVQLIAGKGASRYDKASQIAEDLKVMAKATKTIVVIASQVSRPSGETPEIGLHDAKESGSLENSCGLVIGAWRDQDDQRLLKLRVLKASRGGAGTEINCNFDGPQMRITERAII